MQTLVLCLCLLRVDAWMMGRSVPSSHRCARARVLASEQQPAFDGQDALAPATLIEQLKQKGHNVAGVYAVMDETERVRFVGTSRDVAFALGAHLKEARCLVSSVRLAAFPAPSRSAMAALKREWIAELGYVPDGNAGGEGASLWADSIQRALDSAAAAASEALQQPLRRAAAVTMAEEEAPVVSPFEGGEAGGTSSGFLELTVENVDAALEEVRPYLISDGGNVAVAGIDLESRSARDARGR